MEGKNYLSIVSHYESCLERHGDTHLGVDWRKKKDAETRHRVMLEVMREAWTDFPARSQYSWMACHTSLPVVEAINSEVLKIFFRNTRRAGPLHEYDGRHALSSFVPGDLNIMNRDLDKKIEDLLAAVLQMPRAKITADLAMQDVDVWDSLKHMELIISLEQAFNLQLSFDEIVAMRSVREIKRVLAERGVLS